MNIQNKIMEIANNFDYTSSVTKGINEYREFFKNEKITNIILLNVYLSKEFKFDDEEELAEKVANEVIRYKIKEKIFIKLMSEGIIYPVQSTNGWENIDVKYISESSTESTTLSFRRLLFDQFMKA
ncbi:hypothetical protein LGK95_02705 [Clostridium algoriphilum]|uniref:hypothetical protein n=1 Tax=Clostridium algoriphilum TaxID=198347 RepID=UPI001CF22128|nr:hypothetical protein [Clostridium algoriphilum]MCB2292450.1 hypothetical protein [Clostridium algoriphilum]